MKLKNGFTLIEVLVTITIVSILIALAAPSFRTQIQSVYMSTTVNTFLSDMRFARSEAIRRGGGVVLCRSNAPETTQACNGATGATNGWVSGWIIFHDLNNNGARDATDVVLRVQSPITAIDSIMDGSAVPLYTFRFSALGRLPINNGVTLQFGGLNFRVASQRIVCVNVGGRARISGNGNAACP